MFLLCWCRFMLWCVVLCCDVLCCPEYLMCCCHVMLWCIVLRSSGPHTRSSLTLVCAWCMCMCMVHSMLCVCLWCVVCVFLNLYGAFSYCSRIYYSSMLLQIQCCSTIEYKGGVYSNNLLYFKWSKNPICFYIYLWIGTCKNTLVVKLNRDPGPYEYSLCYPTVLNIQ